MNRSVRLALALVCIFLAGLIAGGATATVVTLGHASDYVHPAP